MENPAICHQNRVPIYFHPMTATMLLPSSLQAFILYQIHIVHQAIAIKQSSYVIKLSVLATKLYDLWGLQSAIFVKDKDSPEWLDVIKCQETPGA